MIRRFGGWVAMFGLIGTMLGIRVYVGRISGPVEAAPSLTLGAPISTYTPTVEDQPTRTPLPDLLATQAELRQTQSALNVLATEQSSVATAIFATVTQEAEQVQAERENELWGNQLGIEQTRLDAALASLDHQIELQKIELDKALALALNEIKIENFYLQTRAWINLVGIAGLWFAGLVVVVLLIAAAIDIFVKNEKAQKTESFLKRQAELDASQVLLDAERKASKRAIEDVMMYSFICDSIVVNGADDHKFPAAGAPGMEAWHNNRRTDVVELLKRDGVVYTSNQGTFIKAGTLGEARDDFENIDPPSPTGGAEGARIRNEARIRDLENV